MIIGTIIPIIINLCLCSGKDKPGIEYAVALTEFNKKSALEETLFLNRIHHTTEKIKG
jgi:hypothetical protein